MPIHSLVFYMHAFDKVIIMMEDMRKKKQIGLICLASSLNDELMPSSVDKGLKFKGIKDLDAIEVSVKWNEFYELVQLEKEENIQESHRDSK